MILGRARRAFALRLEFPAVFQHQRINDGDRDQVVQLFQLAEDQGAMRPGAGEGDIEVVTIFLRLETAFSGRAGCAIRCDPVAELRGAALEMPLGFLGVVPDVLPHTFHQHAHDDLLDCFPDGDTTRFAQSREPARH